MVPRTGLTLQPRSAPVCSTKMIGSRSCLRAAGTTRRHCEVLFFTAWLMRVRAAARDAADASGTVRCCDCPLEAMQCVRLVRAADSPGCGWIGAENGIV